MGTKIRLKHFCLFSLLLGVFSLSLATNYQHTPIFAAKVLGLEGFQPIQIEHIVKEWESIGISHVFVLDNLYKEAAFRHSLSKTSIKPWLIHQTFFSNHNIPNTNITESNPEWLAITESGKLAKDGSKEGSWLVMACPNHTDYRKENIARAVKQVQKWQPYGLSIDFIRFFAFWELSHNQEHQGYDGKSDPLVDSCFCPTCMEKFFAYLNETPPSHIHSPAQISQWIHKNRQTQWVEFKNPHHYSNGC